MNKLSKEKRTKIVLVLILTGGVITGLWFGLINYQRNKADVVSKKIADLDQQIANIQKTVADAKRLENELTVCTEKLDQIENTMASGDLFSWMVSTLKQFNAPSYKVEIPQFGAPQVGDVTLLPRFPYKQATVAVGGTAYYYDLGKFLADLENHFPYMRIQNLVVEPSQIGNPDEKEKLSFRMEVVAVIKPTAP